MAGNRNGTQIETLIGSEDWQAADALIESRLLEKPDDHWLWSRLSGVRYEQRDYKGALKAAEKALEIVPDCPLAIWSKANAVEMLGKAAEAGKLYAQLFRRGLEELKNPDEDANECWEGADWTLSLMVDCLFRIAGCLAKTRRRDSAIETYRDFLSLADLSTQGIYSREDALARLKKLLPNKNARREAAMKRMEKMEELLAN